VAYRLKSDETVPQALQRIACEELEDAAQGLVRARAATRDEAVHEARKSVKKIRAVLRLVRSELGATYATENRRLQSTGRRLSEYRDAEAIIETFDSLRGRYGEEWDGRAAGAIRQALVRRKKERLRGAAVQQIQKVAAPLEKAVQSVARWPLRRDGFAALAPGLAKTYRQGRKAMAQARKHSRPEYCHEWRKRLKDHWYHVRLLEDLWTDVMEGYEKSLKELETWLGDHHNLHVLRQALLAEPDRFGRRADVDSCLQLIAKYQKELRKKSLSLGERVYEERPRQFIHRMQGLWDAWQTQPKSLDEGQKEKRNANAGA
jgi:CHAD domain-containing protein